MQESLVEALTAGVAEEPEAEVIIRQASHDELEPLTDMAMAFLRETVYKERIRVDRNEVRETVSGLLERCTAVVAEADERLVGMLIFMVAEHPLTRDRTAFEAVWWVEPSWRGRVGRMILAEAELLARGAGAQRMQLTAWNERLCRLYERIGYRKTEWVFQRELM